MTELDKAWAAGFFDGEGSVRVTRQRRGDKVARWISMSVSQSDRRPLERFQTIMGGKIIPVGPSAVSKRQRWAWYLTGRARIMAAMDALLPYLSEPKRDDWAAAQAECPIVRPARVFGSRAGLTPET